MTYKFINGDSVKYQSNLDLKDELEALGFKLDHDEPEEGDVTDEVKPKRKRKKK